MTIQEKAIQLCSDRDAKGIFNFLDKMQSPDHLPMMVSIGAAGSEAHNWAWEALEDWQFNEDPTWINEKTICAS